MWNEFNEWQMALSLSEVFVPVFAFAIGVGFFALWWNGRKKPMAVRVKSRHRRG